MRGKQTEIENVSAMWEKIIDKGYFRIRKYLRGKQHTMKVKHPCEEKNYINKDSGSC